VCVCVCVCVCVMELISIARPIDVALELTSFCCQAAAMCARELFNVVLHSLYARRRTLT